MSHEPSRKDVNFSSDPRWLWGVLAGFALLIIANGVMIYFATAEDSSHVIGEKPYEMGLRYDETINEANLTRATGWTYELTQCEEMQLCITLTDRSGAPMEGAEVNATLLRPSDPALDTKARLEMRGAGRYGLRRIPGKGLWELTLDVTHGEHQARWTRSLYLEP